jgi:hypothetical protein
MEQVPIFLQPWRWRRYFLPKRQLTFTGLHGVVSHMTELLTTTAVKTSNHIYWVLFEDAVRTFIHTVGSLCLLNYAPRHNDVWWERWGIAPRFLDKALDGDEWTASSPGSFTPGERAPGTRWIGDWVDPRAGLDAVEKTKCLSLAGNRTPAVQSVVRRIPTDLRKDWKKNRNESQVK